MDNWLWIVLILMLLFASAQVDAWMNSVESGIQSHAGPWDGHPIYAADRR